ncbi:MAG: non-homologous end-joining DNA ligase [Chitinivibrionales bacterium]|nr:non-homologous end-joining DNA ligase [Chitinivibrionales bacterium]
MTLKQYKQKRNLKKTPEPKGVALAPKVKGHYPVFVIHKHAARRLHYDLRLEMDGVLKSWAVPKGPSLDPSVKRLAVKVEDHPYDYKDFEGVIPKGNYGAGNVIIWDRGFYGSPGAIDKKEHEKTMLTGLKKGDLKIVLAGEKIKGLFALVKTKWDDKSWLLIKEKDQYAASEDVTKKDRSVLSGKTVEELREAPVLPSLPSDVPVTVSPMLATAIKKPFIDPDWIFEIKWDGYRAIAIVGKKKVMLHSRNQKSFSLKFAPIVASLKKLAFEAVLDGEVVAVNNKGLPDFQMLQDYEKSGLGRLIYYVFDILYYQGRNLKELPLIERKELLKKILPSLGNIKFADHVWKEGVAFFNAATRKGLEGIVAKDSKSIYREGIRSPHWLKIKKQMTQDCVIAGFTAPKGSRSFLGSLVLGAFTKGELTYIGESGGSFGGIKPKAIYERLKPLAQKENPFKTPLSQVGPITWVRPLLVCEVAFTEWTKEGMMRHPVFIRFRDDIAAEEATR